MKLSKRKNRLNYSEDGLAPKRAIWASIRRKISIWVYYSILVAFFLAIGRFMWTYFFVISAEGKIEVMQWTVRAPYDLRLERLYFFEGDTVAVGDTLFYAESVKLERPKPEPVADHKQDKAKILLEHKLSQNYITLKSLKKQRSEILRRIEAMKERIYLELPVRGSIEGQMHKLNDVEMKLEEIRSERKAMKKTLKELQDIPVEMPTTGAFFSAEVSRVKGQISAWMKRPGDMALKGEQIAVIGSLEKPKLRAYFDLRHLPLLVVGNEVRLNLPDGSSHAGEVSVVYREARPMPKIFTTSSYDAEPKIMVDIIPGDGEKWPLIDGIVVSVSMKRRLEFD